jgi:beta-glucanase (GH16 family)
VSVPPCSFSRSLLAGLGCLACLFLALAAGAGTPVWQEEFSRDGAPDPARWAPEEGFVRNGEAQYYTVGRPENARVEKGLLIIEARSENFPNPHYTAEVAASGATVLDQLQYARNANASRRNATHTAASLTTKGRFEFLYGRVEIRARVPRGRGLWPALWMLRGDIDQVPWPLSGEIDLMEYVGFLPGVLHANVHCSSRYAPGVVPERDGYLARRQVPDLEEGFHVYSLEWEPERLRLSVDDQLLLEYPNLHQGPGQWPFDRPMYLILNLAVGGSWGGEQGVDEHCFPARLEVDYVRVFARADAGPR